ncbi:MAG: PadR family transcriptional regulator [Candidatus Bathyarchaeota archaeon]
MLIWQSMTTLTYDRATKDKCVRNFLELIVLRALQDKPLCGYGIISNIHEKHNTLFSPGTVYPILTTLEKDKFIVNVGNKKKKIYSLTYEGRDTVANLFKAYMKILDTNRPQMTEAKMVTTYST